MSKQNCFACRDATPSQKLCTDCQLDELQSKLEASDALAGRYRAALEKIAESQNISLCTHIAREALK